VSASAIARGGVSTAISCARVILRLQLRIFLLTPLLISSSSPTLSSTPTLHALPVSPCRHEEPRDTSPFHTIAQRDILLIIPLAGGGRGRALRITQITQLSNSRLNNQLSGCVATVGALVGATVALRTGNRRTFNQWLRFRVM
jgi:hypothetical protein